LGSEEVFSLMPCHPTFHTQAKVKRFVGEQCPGCGDKSITNTRDACPHCNTRILPDGRDFNALVREGKFSGTGKYKKKPPSKEAMREVERSLGLHRPKSEREASREEAEAGMLRLEDIVEQRDYTRARRL
jgi:hypothetical protein